ncbi:hypothetical protein KZ686_00165 [Cupriavidus cauae]|uniref:hypothetical protein n=1 Tax=Cupriavidus cauae TaxID=2608999 RepID=UPI0022436ECD|nr:hypothetical protein [Cupriavidus cauae]UZN50775.1 hypothetical protein KZ686_00165 [Cupriavidus cauae]
MIPDHPDHLQLEGRVKFAALLHGSVFFLVDRDFPLIDLSEEIEPPQRFAFPRYTSAEGTKADIASATIAKWIRGMGIEHTAHELRHTMADRLREVQCPEDIRFAIGGWASKDIGSKYGKGYSLRVMAEWLAKVAI